MTDEFMFFSAMCITKHGQCPYILLTLQIPPQNTTPSYSTYTLGLVRFIWVNTHFLVQTLKLFSLLLQNFLLGLYYLFSKITHYLLLCLYALEIPEKSIHCSHIGETEYDWISGMLLYKIIFWKLSAFHYHIYLNNLFLKRT